MLTYLSPNIPEEQTRTAIYHHLQMDFTELLTWTGSQSQWLSEQTHHLLIPWSVIFWTNSISYNSSCKNLQNIQLSRGFFIMGNVRTCTIWNAENWKWEIISSVQFSSVAQSCVTLCDPMDCSPPGFPVHHQLPESTQTYVHWVGDAIQPSHPLSFPSPLHLI